MWAPAVMLAAGSRHSQVEVPGTVDCGTATVQTVPVTLSATVSVPERVLPGIRVEPLAAATVIA